ncbi:DEAD/DEAH box helicase [Candidatus Woesearchaeota archaeon]|nr:DEAD/DEAH box helicase [Candidatus Woesearchaeota archaeon]
MIKNFKPRLYQETILATCVEKNTLVVLPTGLGKTNLAVLLAAHRLRQYPQSKILIVAPTKPLVEQIMQRFIDHLDVASEKITMFTGSVAPEKRQELWSNAVIISSTPQGLENDVISKRINLEEVSLLVFDEAHRAVGDYSYVWLAKQYEKTAKFPRILALTASPGSDLEKINEVITNLFIEEIEVRIDSDPDVKPYVQEVDIAWVEVILPDTFKAVHKYLHDCFISKLKEISSLGYLDQNTATNATKTDILKLQAHLQGEIASGNRELEVLKSLSLAAEAMKVQHAIELLETQSIAGLHNYLSSIQMQARTSKVKAVQNLVRDLNFRSAIIKTNTLMEETIKHPKLHKLKEIVQDRIQKNPDYKIIIFTQYRDSGSEIMGELNLLQNIKAQLFVGQAKKKETGLSQKEQIAMLEEFRNGKFNVLVSSSVGEEGLDIPQVDLVIFYEPIPSAIRHIQRRGRTGRSEKGEVIILMTKDTRDEGYRWSAHHKEKRMYTTLKTLRTNMKFSQPERKQPAKTLSDFSPQQQPIKIFADYREKGSGVIKELLELGASLTLEKLETADYLLSSDAAVEYKTQDDFIDSLIDGRLLQQIKIMKSTFQKPLVLVEGMQDLYSIRNINPNAIRGMIATITVSFNIPLIYTKTFKDSAAMLYTIAKREQDEKGRDFSLHGSKKPLDIFQQQEYLVSALPGVGATLAKPLLRKFKNIKNLVNATEEDLKQVDLIGEIKAKNIKKVLDNDYSEF